MVADAFLKECLFNDYQRLKTINLFLKDMNNYEIVDLDMIVDESFRLIHTIKGTLGFLKYDNEVKELHQIETNYLQMIKKEKTLDEFYPQNLKVEKIISIIVKQAKEKEQQKPIELQKIFESIQQKFEHFIELHQKNIRILSVTTKSTIPFCLAQDVYRISYQIIKNAICHGYHDRSMVITINAMANTKVLKIKIANDGKPINFKKLLSNANKRHPNARIDNVLYLKSVTTTENRDEMSGSGIGLNCVKEILNKLKGKMQITTQEDSTIFYIAIPL